MSQRYTNRETAAIHAFVTAVFRPAWLVACVAAVLLCASCWPATGAEGGEEDQPLKVLGTTWEAQRLQVATARIRYRYVSTGPAKLLADLDPQQVREIVGSVDLKNHPDDLRVLFERLHAPDYFKRVMSRHKHPWSVYVFYAEGAKTRQEGPGDGGENVDVRMFDGVQDVIASSANHQVDIYAPGASRRYRTRLVEFREVPTFQPTDKSPEWHQDGQFLFRFMGQRSVVDLLVDESTGLVVQETRRNKYGIVLSELFQMHPVTYPGHVTFPSVVIDVHYDRGRLAHLDIVMIEEARFNGALGAGTFPVAAKAGTKVLDWRGKTDRPRFFRLQQATPDVVSYVDGRIRAIAEGGN